MAHFIAVWRESAGTVEPVGRIASYDGAVRFCYDSSYTGRALSCSLPVQSQPLPAAQTAAFFAALIPEGSAKEELARSLHAESGEFVPYLEHLGDESLGALLFALNDAAPYAHPAYEPVEDDLLSELAERPLETAVASMGKTRLSLSGAMAKMGLYRSDTGRWYYPLGGAPSTHILKAADSRRFPLETVNEAVCLGAARRCGFPVAECELIDTGGREPLIAVKRFDRVMEQSRRTVSGMRAPARLHQEDFCQATGLSLKYEPTDASYLSLITSTAGRNCSNSFGEAQLLVEYTILNYLLGNCDNHLKNHALLYSPSWDIREVAPLYDLVSTVEYPSIYREMGVSFGGSRRIDDVTCELVTRAITACNMPPSLAFSCAKDLSNSLPEALQAEAAELERKGFPQARTLAISIAKGVKERARIILAEA